MLKVKTYLYISIFVSSIVLLFPVSVVAQDAPSKNDQIPGQEVPQEINQKNKNEDKSDKEVINDWSPLFWARLIAEREYLP